MDRQHRSFSNCFASVALDRAFEKRKDEAWLRAQLTDPATRFIPLWRHKCLINTESRPHLVTLDAAEYAAAHIDIEPVFLGQQNQQTYFATEVSGQDHDRQRLEVLGELIELRTACAVLSDQDAAVLGYARAMLHWHRHHQHCGTCGSATVSQEGGHLRRCANAQCARSHFPRTDPAVIVIVTHEDRCLLGRDPAWPPGQYSVVAGFVEPGEPLEAAVAREVFEETGIHVHSINYLSSQPWPFPGSIMLGYSAETDDPRLNLNRDELEDALWVTREELREAVQSKRLKVPTRISIAYRLVQDWYDAGGVGCLDELSIVTWQGTDS
ncbi:MAG: NAD(+) diphosphatase [Gammaproteobacteria bacterium]|nr:NAD(+) diphosphatase [Gammaproteobacteria bacterium]MDH3465726.1 NAD(+) diphosphatase [Gammaproteobacteria bacterium]